MKKIVLFLAALNMAIFAQEPERFAVYVSGAGEAGVNKSLGNKMTAAISHSGQYAEIRDPDAFYKEVAKKTEPGAIQVAEIAKKHGASFICAVGATEVLGTHSFSARLIRTDNLQVAKVVSLDHQIKSVEDLTIISNEIAARLLNISPAQTAAPRPPQSAPIAPVPAAPLAPQAPASAASTPPAAPPAAKCWRKYNVNELIFTVKDALPKQLKDCGSSFVKELALSKVPFSKKAAPEPKAFITQCAIDGIKEKLPEHFPGVDKVIDDLQNSINSTLNLAMSGASLDPAKLASAIGDMKIDWLLSRIKKMTAENPCIVNEPYEHVEEEEGEYYVEEEEDYESGSEGKSIFSLGFRLGMNLSHLYTEEGVYESAWGFQFGPVFDFAISEMFHIQPGLMYILKGAEDNRGDILTLHYIEIPVLFSLKLSAFRLNAGPYFGFAGSNITAFDENDIGISAGLGFDIGAFYIGAFYDYGLTKYNVSYSSYNYSGYRTNRSLACNRTLGFNIGVNL